MAMMKFLPYLHQQLGAVLIMLCVVHEQANAQITRPKTLIARGSTRSCLPVFNCEENHFVKVCEKSGMKETCEPCPEGEVQPKLISSLDSEEDRKCFRPAEKHACPVADTVHSRIPYVAVWCSKKCRCNTNKCFYGAPCSCEYKEEPCKVNEELDDETGECKPCEEGKHKPFVGCGPCRFITPEVTSSPSDSTTVSLTTIQDPDPQRKRIEGTEGVSVWIILLAVIVVVKLVVLIITCACWHCTRKKIKQSPSQDAIDPEKGGVALLQEGGGEQDDQAPIQATLQENDIPNADDDPADVSKNSIQPKSNDCDPPVSPSFRDIHGIENAAKIQCKQDFTYFPPMTIVNGPSIPPEPSENEEDTLLKSSSSFM